MNGSFSEIKLFQVRPDRLAEFEALIRASQRRNSSSRAVLKSSTSSGSSR